MAFRDFLADGESEAGPAVLGFIIQSLEKHEESPDKFFRDADSVVAKLKEDTAVSFGRTDVNPGWLFPAEFDPVTNQVLKKSGNLRMVCANGRKRVMGDDGVMLLDRAIEILDRFLKRFRTIHELGWFSGLIDLGVFQ